MNVPHLLILLHNSMRTSSTNSIMIGIAICDLITLSQNVYERVQGYWFYGVLNSCMNQDNYWYMYSLLIGDFLLTVFERASFWLGLFLAFTRFVIMKMMTTTLEISKPLYGYLLILVLVGLSSAHSLYYYGRYNIVQWDTWEPEETHRTCRLILVMTILYVISSAPAGFSEYVTLFMTVQPDSVLGILVGYGSIFISALFCLNASLHGIINFTMSSKYRQTVRECLGLEKPQRGSMVFVTILVSVLYPILTILLIFVIRKSAKFTSRALNSRITEERHRTCRLILVMSIFYVIGSAPAGFLEYVGLFVTVEPNSILETLLGYGSIFISALFCLNASSHGIINFTMSSKYRKTVKMCLGMDKPQPQGNMASVTVTKTSSHS
ncbi:hypothetical protein B9Z55_017332 [Caenorhabditis nigoni]|nr:hypothetical protein B9Z55_017332 [Caenorhabditis nigoni]